MKLRWLGIFITIVVALGATLYFTVFNKPSFIGEITYIGESFILVDVTDDPNYNGSYSISISDETEILDFHNNQTSIAYLSEGDLVRITFKGSILESNPAQIKECTKIALYTEN